MKNLYNLSGINLALIEIHLKQLKDCHVLLTSTPRITQINNTFKLACVKHIASIHSEPGSRSYLYVLKSNYLQKLNQCKLQI